MGEWIDTRLLTDNVFYREKTFLRQLFFDEGVARTLDARGALQLMLELRMMLPKSDSLFRVMR
jgi:hypothetical protein